MGKFPLALAALALSAGAALGDVSKPTGALMDVAMACSNKALARFAQSSNETANAVAGAAFDICRGMWLKAETSYAAEHARTPGKSFDDDVETARDGFRIAYLRMMTAMVFELRAASPASKKTPSARDY
jgi:hypothetical protein